MSNLDNSGHVLHGEADWIDAVFLHGVLTWSVDWVECVVVFSRHDAI